MACQKRSSGRRYDSSRGNDFIIGDESKGIIGMVLYYKACWKCDVAGNIGEESEELVTKELRVKLKNHGGFFNS